ncbi:hypothetical protein [Prosthecochloris sp.]|uniref:hypothetical protein n=1 Tax=Prosthecochloris sp. TaxID=290513 RepID=UPI0025CFC45F|nr:hypothetical protein [Prosthecochloris sp.]
MANLNIKTALTGGSINCVDRNVAGMKVGGSVCWAFVSGIMMCYKFDSSSTVTADGVNVIIPFGQSLGTPGRWVHYPTKYLQNAVSDTDITLSADGKGIKFSDGTKIIFTSGAGLKVIPNNDNYPLLIRNSTDSETVALFKPDAVEITGLVPPAANRDAATKEYVDDHEPAELNTASGSAPSFSARAWVSFNGVGTVSIRGSGNVDSITDNDTGDYTAHFETAMPDANYCVCPGVSRNDRNQKIVIDESGVLAASVTVFTGKSDGGSHNVAINPDHVFLAIFR